MWLWSRFDRPPHNFFDVELMRDLADAFEALDDEARLPRCWCWPRKANRSAPAPTSSRRPAEGGELGLWLDRRPLRPGGPAVLLAEADGGGHSRRSGRRRARPGAGRRFPRRVAGGPVRRQLRQARLSSGLRPDPHAAAPDRPAARQPDVLHRPPRPGRRGGRMGPRRSSWRPPDRASGCRQDLAREIAENAPLAVQSTRATLRAASPRRSEHDRPRVRRTELALRTEDHSEGVRAVAERRPGRFEGR